MDWKYSRRGDKPTREIQITDTLSIGGTHKTTLVMAGPCSAESPEQLDAVAKVLVSQGVKVLRAGCFKPRTSPYSFFGLGEEGLQMLVDIRNKYGLAIITEARDSTHIDLIIEHADIVQIGAKAMWDYGILRACGRSKKPVLLKRSFGAKLKELAQAAEFILNEGNPNVMLCERGIRTFESDTRFTLDLCGVAWLKKNCLLPIVLDPSHAMGARYGVPDLTRACVAMGIDGLLIETHPCPAEAKSDAAQQLSLQQFTSLHSSLGSIANAVGKRLI